MRASTALLAILVSTARAADTEFGFDIESAEDLKSLSLEEILDIPITIASKKEESSRRAAAAVHVITQEDIRRSGLRSIPEILRMVPGLQVARIDATRWAISARGFNDRFANKLLVMIDGRTIYTPLFAGVFWEVQDTVLADIERIEVVRGPGGTLWGANAVNGVINIVTKSAAQTHGVHAFAGGGTEEQAFVGARYGSAIGEDLHYRIWAKGFLRDGLVNAGGHQVGDDWYGLHSGFRVDWDPRSSDTVTLLGGLHYVEFGTRRAFPTLVAPYAVTLADQNRAYGGHLLGRWFHEISDSQDLQVQIYYDHTSRREMVAGENRDMIEASVQHHLELPLRQDVVWGLDYRYSNDEVFSGPFLAFNDKHRAVHLVSAFLQDEITLAEDLLRLTIGTKAEYNDHTKFEIQPSGRLLLTPAKNHTVWGAVSRAVRTPSRAIDDVIVPLTAMAPNPPTVPLPVWTELRGRRGIESEDLLAFELGYRTQPVEQVALEIAGFFNIYEHLDTYEPGAILPQAGPPPHLLQPLYFDDEMDAETWGVEVEAKWHVTDFWNVSGSYTFLGMALHAPTSNSPIAEDAERQSPRNQFQVHSHLSLPWDLSQDLALYWVDSLGAHGVPSYFRLDLGLTWRPTDFLEVRLVGQNLLDDRHPEFGNVILTDAYEVERGFYFMLTFRH